MSHSTIREVEALVSLSRTQSRLAQEYRQMAAQYADDTYEREHDRLRIESVRHMRSAYRLRDRFYELKTRDAALSELAQLDAPYLDAAE